MAKKYKLELDQKSLASVIEAWFQDHDINDRNVLTKNPVAKVLKRNMCDKNTTLKCSKNL